MRSGATDPKVDIPEIEVTFTNGVKQNMILRHYDAIPSSNDADHSRLCNYLGHLEGDEVNSTVAVTGCLIGDDQSEKMHITLLSQNSPKHKSFSVDMKGNTKLIEIESRQNVPKMIRPDHHVTINEQWEEAAAKVSAMQRSTVPPIIGVNIRLGFDRTTKEYFQREDRNNWRRNLDNWLAEVMTHSQVHFLHSSLKHQIILQVGYS